MKKTEQIMPGFVFARRRDIELEAGFILAGQLFVDIPKRAKLKGHHQRMLDSILKQLIRMAAEMPDDAVIYGWRDGCRPANADAITDNDELMAAWARDRCVVAVRVESKSRNNPDADLIRIDSDIAKQLGLIREH